MEEGRPPPPDRRNGELTAFRPPSEAPDQVMAIYDPLHAYEVHEDELDLRELWRTVLKYRTTIGLFFAVVVVTTLIGTLMMRPVYRASVLLEVKPRSGSIVKFQGIDAGDIQAKEFMATQAEILESESVGLAVIERLHLDRDPEISGKIRQRGLKTGFKQIVSALSPGKQDQSIQVGADQEAVGRPHLGRYFDRLSVQMVRSSQLFRVRFDSFSPELAAKVANTVAEEYIRLNVERKFSSNSSAKSFLNQEISRLQARLETSERDLYEFARRHQVVDVEDRNNFMTVRLANLNAEVTRVRSERISAESLYSLAREGNAQNLPQILEQPLVVSLKERYASLEGEYFRLSKVFKPKYPRLQEIRADMEQVNPSMVAEIDRQVASLGMASGQLKRREDLLSSEVDRLKNEIFDLQDRAVQYNILKREWETNRELYSGLLERMKEVDVAAGLEINNVAIIDRASRGGKFKPNLLSNLAKAGLLGLFGGLGLAFLLAFLDNTVRTPEELEQVVHLANLGLLPLMVQSKERSKAVTKKLDLASHLTADNELAEAFRSVRTSLMFSTPDGAPQVLLITSASSGEGKTTAVINLATVFAQNGEQVLVVDADLRKPRAYKTLKVPHSPGLTEYLVQAPLGDIAQTFIPGVSLLPSGIIPPNPVELLGSKTFDIFIQMMRGQFDRIIIDAPPVLGLADAIIVSTKVDGVMLVVSAGRISKDALKQCVKRLRMVRAPLVGCVLNNVDVSSSEYGEYSRYYYNYKKPVEKNSKISSLMAHVKANYRKQA